MRLPCRVLFFLLLFSTTCLKAQLKEIRAIQQQLPAIKDSTAYVDALNRLAMLYHLKSIDTCFYITQKTLPIAERHKYNNGRAGALNNLGIVHLLKQNIYLATKYFNTSLELYRAAGDSANQCQLLMNIGLTLITDGKAAEGNKYLTSAYELGNRLTNDSIMALVLLNLVNDTVNIAPDSADVLLNRAEAIATRYNDYRCLAAVKQMRGEEFFRRGKRTDGLQAFKQSLQMCTGQGIEYEKISVDIDLGDAYLADNDTTAGLGYYKDALATATANGYQGQQVDITQKIYDYYTKQNNATQAAVYAATLIKAYKNFRLASQESGVNYMDYSIKLAEVEALKSDRRANVLVIIILSVLSTVIIILLIFVLRAQQARKKYVELLKQRNEQAGNRNAALHHKNEFNSRLISLLAHDFRQPLAAVKGMMSLLKEPGALSQDEMNLLISRIETSSDTSLDIFDNILHWIKKQLSGFVYEPTAMQLQELVDDAAKSLQYIAEKFNVTIVNNITDATNVLAEKEMLQFVNRNLIHNAIKFSPAGTAITVSAMAAGNEIIVSVKDEGKGMNSGKLAALFNIFSKTQYASDKEKGSGVALVICKDFLERMNGRIWAESEPGKGATFFYALPRFE